MPSVEYINEPIIVEVRLADSGDIEPRAFRWRGQTYRIAETGRHWHEDEADETWLCYLVRTPDASAFELRLNETTGGWLLARAWLTQHSV